MKTLTLAVNGNSKTKHQPLAKIVMETQDLLHNRIVLSVLINREVVKVSPTELLANPEMVNRLSKAEVERAAYLSTIQESDAALCARHNQPTPVRVGRASVTKIVVETQNPLTDKVEFTVLHNRDLVKLSPLSLMSRHDIIRQMSKRDTDRMFYMLTEQVETVKTKAEALLAGGVA